MENPGRNQVAARELGYEARPGAPRFIAPLSSKEDSMLVLTRKKGQRIRIGLSVELTVLEIRGGSVKLGFEAPPNISIHRDEIRSRFNGHGDLEPSPPASVEVAAKAVLLERLVP
jgi:carbon storage regulator